MYEIKLLPKGLDSRKLPTFFFFLLFLYVFISIYQLITFIFCNIYTEEDRSF